MKASELRSMTREELEHEMTELREEEFRLRLRRPTDDLPNALRLRTIRRDISRIQSTLREDKLGLIELPRKSRKETEEAKPATPDKPAAEKKTTTKKATGKKSATSKSPRTTRGSKK